MTEPYVHALAIVRARDGRSILDRDPAGSEPERRFAADPDRMHAAVTVLGAHGVTVTGVAVTALWLRGERTAVEAACGCTLDLTEDDTTWTVTDPTPGPVLDVGRGPLVGLVHQVLLTTPTPPRDTGAEDPHAPRPVPHDLLLGEIGGTLDVLDPPRLGTTAPFPADPFDSADMFAKTRRSLRMRALLQHPVVARRSRSAAPAPVTLVVSETDGAAHFGTWFERLSGGAPARRRWFSARGPAGDPEAADSTGMAVARTWGEVATNATTIDEIVAEFDVQGAIAEHDKDAAKVTLFTTEAPLRTAVTQLHAWYLDRLQRKLAFPAGWPAHHPDGWDPAMIVAIYDFVEDSAIKDAMAVLSETGLGAHVSLWATLARQEADRIRRNVLRESYSHGAMSAFTALGVTGTAVEMAVVTGNDAGAAEIRKLLDRNPTAGYVISMSWGSCAPNSAAAWRSYQHEVASVLRRSELDRVLLVTAAGNSNTQVPVQGAILGTVTPNWLVVGGCTPANVGWTASGRTHGYSLDDAWWPPGGVSVPSVCAVSDSANGGAVLHPVPMAPPRDANDQTIGAWDLGGGSSQATPVVAAVCALVWTVHPSLTASQVRSAVLAGTERVRTGVFHEPTDLGPGFVPNSNTAATNPGSRRVLLSAALDEAVKIRPKPATSTLLEHRR